MAIKLYDLAGEDLEMRFSPFCWRTKLALAHKGLAFETIPWRFHEKEAIAESGQPKVPVIVDGDRWVHDSWTIAEYLDETYPDRPMLFSSPEVKAHIRFLDAWVGKVLFPALAKSVMVPLQDVIAEENRAYFRETREKVFGMTLEQLGELAPSAKEFSAMLSPLRSVLAKQPFLGGDAPDYGDYLVFGPFQWARCSSPDELLQADDPVALWRGRILDLYDGLGRNAPARCAA